MIVIDSGSKERRILGDKKAERDEITGGVLLCLEKEPNRAIQARNTATLGAR